VQGAIDNEPNVVSGKSVLRFEDQRIGFLIFLISALKAHYLTIDHLASPGGCKEIDSRHNLADRSFFAAMGGGKCFVFGGCWRCAGLFFA
jgi:hypothetical protein